MKRILHLMVALAVGGCGGAAADDAATAPLPVETFVPEDASIHNEILQLAINQTGLADVPVERWVQLAEAGCRQGAWQRLVASGLAAAFIDSLEAAQREHLEAVSSGDGQLMLDEMARLVWGATLAGCRDHFPQAEIERGPPGGTGQ